jgi:hypothetical protein
MLQQCPSVVEGDEQPGKSQTYLLDFLAVFRGAFSGHDGDSLVFARRLKYFAFDYNRKQSSDQPSKANRWQQMASSAVGVGTERSGPGAMVN